MKKVISLMLTLGITAGLYAQSSDAADKAFRVPENILFHRKFYVDLGEGNKMKLELSDLSDLQVLSNTDSLLQVFLQDITPLKDSFSDPLTSKRIDYVTDAEGRKKIRFQQYQPKGSSFILQKGELSSLKTCQDTISIIGILVNPPHPTDRINPDHPRYYHLIFYLNDLAELSTYREGILAAKIATLQQEVTGRWPLVLGTGYHYLAKDNTITADEPRGFTAGGRGDFLQGNISVNVQNYKNYFVPSFSLGMTLTLTNPDKSFKWEPGLFWEPNFIFSKDNLGNLHTYRNDFLTLTYGQGGTRDHDPRKDFSFSAVFSMGYLVNRQGDYFDKNTFRFGAGKLSLLKTTIEPSLYFTNFLKGVTPSIRISQYF